MAAIPNFLKNPYLLVPLGVSGTYIAYDYVRTGQTENRYVIGDQSGRAYIVTGATSGIGKELTHELAQRKATVIMACRNKNKCLEVRRDIVLKTRNKKVYCRMCDLSDPSSVHSFVQKLSKADNPEFQQIDGVVLNAATKCKNYTKNADGIEGSLAANHMGSFLMVALLLQKLLQQEIASKILFIGTDISAKDTLNLELDKLNEAKFTKKLLSTTEYLDEKGKYDMHAAYKYSKLVQLVFARELAERLKSSKVQVVVADPGGTKTSLNRNEPSQSFAPTRWSTNFFGSLTGSRRKPKNAISPILYALTDEDVTNGTFVNPRRKKRGWGSNAENNELRQMVWKMSEEWTKLAEHFQRMEEELGKPNYFSESADRSDQSEEQRTERPRSAKYLWLA